MRFRLPSNHTDPYKFMGSFDLLQSKCIFLKFRWFQSDIPGFIIPACSECGNTKPDRRSSGAFKTYHALNEADLPDKQLIIKESMAMAEKLDKMRTAQVFDDVYNGPVLFEGQAAGEVVRKTMFLPKE